MNDLEPIADLVKRIENDDAAVIKLRTISQNKALYKWERMLAARLNNAGIPFGDIVIRLPRYFTQENIHELIVLPLLRALYPGKTSTSELSTTEIQVIYEHATKIISERSHGVVVEWPSRHGGGA